MTYNNQILKGDCIEILKNIPNNSVDAIFADPPYNLQLGGDLTRPNDTTVDAVNDERDKFESIKIYDEFCIKWITECQRILKKNGTIWIIGSYHNIFRIGTILQDLGFWILNDILWIKSNPMPNFKGTRFNNAHETLIWASKDKKSKYTFHYQGMKVFNDDKQMRSDRYIPICSGEERIKIDGKKAHSTQKPMDLLYRVILSSTNIGDTILDPFFGSGTTGAVAKLLQRNYIGIEKEEKYISVATDRINSIKPVEVKFLEYKVETPRPKVPFGNIISSGLLKVGSQIFSKDHTIAAAILSDGSIEWAGIVGSIHKISAIALNKTNNNGRTFRYTNINDKETPIDDLRDIYQLNFQAIG